jgi:hypothetical protein
MKSLSTILIFFFFLLATSSAQTKGDPVGLGNGQDGSVSINAFSTVINSYAQLMAPVNAGSKTLYVSSTAGFAANSLVMIIQMSGQPMPPSGNQGPFILTSTNVGRFELIRVQSVGAGTITLVDGVRRSFPGQVTQVVKVPEYTAFTVTTTGSVIAPAWDGMTGGIVAFLATGTVTINSSISVFDVGLRGGMPVQDISGSTSCNGLEEVSPQGARKGESLVSGQYGIAAGRGNLLNGGGGGVCVSAGGGGGANAGMGGKGGITFDGGRNVGGLGGGNLIFDPTTNLVLGGGGGAGHVTDMNLVFGGNGGGIIFIRANSVVGTGSLDASGASASVTEDLGGGTSGAPGGGAGGSIYVRAIGAINLPGVGGVNSVMANGGNGGSQLKANAAPGGGGGGGYVFLQGSNITVIEDVLGGFAGFNFVDPDFIDYQNQDGGSGVFTTMSSGMVIPASPSIASPSNGATTSLRPTISGTGPANTTINLYVDDIPLGSTTINGAGTFSFTPSSDLSVAGHILRATAEVAAIESPYSASVSFTTSGTLPVLLDYFTAKAADKDHIIKWKVAEAINNAFFTLYYSSDNINWRRINEVAHQQINPAYQYTHVPVSSSHHFYRLTQTDLDGRTKDLGTRMISGNIDIAGSIQIYPNPAQDYINIRLESNATLIRVQILSVDGRVLVERTLTLSNNRISLKDLANGTYFIKVQNGDEQSTKAIIIAR